jgi:transposase InsO family protein
MFMEISVMEQKYQAVLAVIRDGISIIEVANRFGVSRQSVHSWLARYEAEGMAGLVERSHRPPRCEHQMGTDVEVRVIELRRQNLYWGPKRIQHQLLREGIDPPPSVSGIYRALKRAKMIEPGARKERDRKFKRWERGGPMELWQMDVVGGILLTDGSELKCLTGVDDHSRFCVMAGLMVRATSRSVCDHFANAMAIHGVPQEILTDNGKVFTGRFNSHKNVEVLFDKICRENGIDHLLTAPRSPTTTGKIERFHRSLRTEFLTGRIFDSKSSAQAELDAWVIQYNTVRPHQGIAMVTPMTRFTSLGNVIVGPMPDTSALDEVRQGSDWVTRRVGANGVVSIAWQQISVGKHRNGHNVDVHIQKEMVQIWDGAELIKSALRNRPGEVIRKKNAQTTSKK